MRATIAGLGLIGGSIGICLRQAGWRVTFIDPSVSLDEARTAGAADQQSGDWSEADLTIIATPVDAAITLLADPLPAEAGIVTTVCSVMEPFARDAVIAGHPIAGAEQRSLAAARGDLFEGARWFIARSDSLVEAMIAACGAQATVVNPAAHDQAVAITSHLPQILSTALAATLPLEVLDFAGGGLATFLRLADSDASVWKPIIHENRSQIEAALQNVVKTAGRIMDCEEEPFNEAQRTLRQLRQSSRRS